MRQLGTMHYRLLSPKKVQLCIKWADITFSDALTVHKTVAADVPKTRLWL